VQITIEGKEFVPVHNGTFAHDIWLTAKVREAGLSDLRIGEDETEDQFIERIAVTAFESGKALELLGGLFMPAGTDARAWTKELAAKTSEFFGNVTDAESKKTLRTQIASALFYFFVNALASSKTSQKSGQVTMKEVDERQETVDAASTEIGSS
jgi:hypothetical protein